MGDTFLISATQDFQESACQNRLFSPYNPPPPIYGVKIVNIINANIPMANLPTLIAAISAQLPAIMALLQYNDVNGNNRWIYTYDWKANGYAFSIGSGVINYGGMGFPYQWGEYEGGQPSALCSCSPYFGTQDGGNPGTPSPTWSGYYSYPGGSGFSVGGGTGYLSLADSNSAVDAAYKTLSWIWVYHPECLPGTGVELWQVNPYDPVKQAYNEHVKVGTLLSSKPEADVETMTTGSVFRIPSPPYAGVFTPTLIVSPPPSPVFLANFGGQVYMNDSDWISGSTGAGGAGQGPIVPGGGGTGG